MTKQPHAIMNDPRTPQQLAEAIVHHDYLPSEDGQPARSFGQALQDGRNQPGMFTITNAGMLSDGLNEVIASGQLTASAGKFQDALDPIAWFRRIQYHRGPVTRYMTSFGTNPFGLSDQTQRSMQNEGEPAFVGLRNLNQIETLVRTLAHKLGITLKPLNPLVGMPPLNLGNDSNNRAR